MEQIWVFILGNKKMFRYIFLFSIFLLGFFLRAQETISGNYLFLLDQGRDMLAVKDIVFGHHLTLIGPYTSLGGVFQGPIWYYLLAIPTFLTNGDPWDTVLLMLILSMGVLVSVFFFTKKYFGIITALLATYLFAISPEAQAAATFSWNPHPMHLLITLFIFFLYQAVYINKKFHLFLWPTLALSFHFETAMGVFLLVSTLLYLFIFQRSAIKNKFFPRGLLISFLFFLPQFLFDIRHDFLMTRSVFKVFSGSSNQGLYTGGEDRGYYYIVFDHLQSFYTNFASSFINNSFLHGLPILIILFMVISILLIAKFKLWNKSEKRIVVLIIAIVFFNIVLSFIYPFPIRSWFLTGFQSFYIILFAVLLGICRKFLLGKILVGIFIILTLIFSFSRLDVLYFHPPDDGGVAKIRGKLNALDAIYTDAKGEPFGLLIFTPPVKTDAYDYLIWWYGSRKYHYVPHNEKKGTFYLLMEPDPGNPSSYNGWLETVIKEGKILETKKMPSGLIIQKRFK